MSGLRDQLLHRRKWLLLHEELHQRNTRLSGVFAVRIGAHGNKLKHPASDEEDNQPSEPKNYAGPTRAPIAIRNA